MAGWRKAHPIKTVDFHKCAEDHGNWRRVESNVYREERGFDGTGFVIIEAGA